MKHQLLEKITPELLNIHTEIQVVYILTRIGKILEIDNKKSIYPILNFYRNWSVHSRIDDTKYIKQYLEDLIQRTDSRNFSHSLLVEQLTKFLENYSLPPLSEKNLKKFIYYLGHVISDTPLIVKKDEGTKYKIFLSNPPNLDSTGTYKLHIKIYVETLQVNISDNVRVKIIKQSNH